MRDSSPDRRNHAPFLSFPKKLAVALLVSALAYFLTGCANISPAQVSNTSGIRMVLSPTSATVPSGSRQQFTAALTSTSRTGVVWKASAGAVSGIGLFTAPVVTSPTRVVVSATSLANPEVFATAEITVVPATKFAILTLVLPAVSSGVPYSATLVAVGGSPPYQWRISQGILPPGLALDASNGVISGISFQAGSFSFTAAVTDATSATVSQPLNLTVSPPTAGNFDGPAELPRLYVQSSLADTPAPGGVTYVPGGGKLQAAINGASCGETIQLQAGAVFTGSFTFPALSCDDNHWIIVRTSAPDSALPPEGTRITPCYAGVPSLPGRPALNCTSTNNVMARIQFAAMGSGPIILQNGANHYRFIGLEITRTPASGLVYNLVLNQRGAADHIIFDRSWLHGTAHDETQRGIMLSGFTNAAVVNSYFSDFHCTSKTGWCSDAQTIGGGIGDLPSGPIKIDGNFLEASGENILFGGGAATATPTDIEVRFNHMFKPLTWMQGQPGYVGGSDGNPFIVKNLFELKNAQRVLFEGNILEDSWGGFTQSGFAILLTPKNQDGGTVSLCPICQVTDVTIRYSTISHVGGGMVLANGVTPIGGVPLAGGRYSIHDITADDINGTKYLGHGDFAQVSMGKGAPVLQPILINHVTAFQSNVMLNLGDDIAVNPAMKSLVFTNNIITAGTAPMETTGGGPTNCAYISTPLTALARCFQSYTFSNNVVIGTSNIYYPPSKYPAGNYFPSTVSAVDFVNFNLGDYRLQDTSPFQDLGTDGTSLGADINMIQAAIAGVE